MTDKLPFDGAVEGLRLHLKRLTLGEAKPVPGQMPTGDQVVALLAMTDDLRIDDTRKQHASAWVTEQTRDGLLTPVPSGVTLEHEPPPSFFIGSFRVRGNSSDQARFADDRQRRFEAHSSGSRAEPSVKPAALAYEVTLIDLWQVLPLLKKSIYWTDTVRLFLGIESVPLSVAVPPTARATVSAVTVVDPVQARAIQVRESYRHVDLSEDKALDKDELQLIIQGAGNLSREGNRSNLTSLIKNYPEWFKAARRAKCKQAQLYSMLAVIDCLIANGYEAHYAPPTLKIVLHKGIKGAAR